MRYVLHVKAANQTAILERILGVVRFRGYYLRSLTATPTRDQSKLDVTLQVEHERVKGNLSLQLARLFDVEAVEMYSEVQQVNFG